jgi:Tol biopolymer transport system component
LKRRQSLAAIWLAVGALAGASITFVTTRAPVPPLEIMNMEISPGVQLSQGSQFALSPDGKKLAFVGRGSDGVTRLWVRPLRDEKARPISGPLGEQVPPIFWSPDSQLVAFYAGGQLKRVDVNDGATGTLCALESLAVGGAWNSDGIIVIGQPSSGLIRCSVADGQVSKLTQVDPDKGETAHLIPFFLPDERHFFYVRVARNAPEGSGVYLGSLDDKPGAAVPQRLLATGFGAAYVPTKGTSIGRIIFLREATLYAQAFDERALELRGDPTALATPVGSFIDGGLFSVSQNDRIAFRPPDKDFQLTWFDEKGNKTGTLGEVGRYTSVDISPDDARVASAREVIGSMIDQDVWTLETSRPTTTKVTFGPVLEDLPVWSFDSRRLMFTNGGDTGNLFEQIADGPTNPRALLETEQHKVPTSASRDFLLYTVANNDHSRLDVWVLPLTGGAKARPFPFIQGTLDQSDARFSPDGQWVAYTSNESGRDQVRVKRFGEPSDGQLVDPETIPVSTGTGGGTAPRWSSDGKKLYYFAADGWLMAADVTMGAKLTLGATRALFPIPARGDWDVVSDPTRFSDGRQFLIAIPTGADASTPFKILVNRLAELGSGR